MWGTLRVLPARAAVCNTGKEGFCAECMYQREEGGQDSDELFDLSFAVFEARFHLNIGHMSSP